MNRGFKMGLAIVVFLLGVFLIFQWAIKEGSTEQTDVQKFNTLLIEVRTSLSKCATVDSTKTLVEDLSKALTESQKALENKCVETMAAHQINLESLHKQVEAMKKEMEFQKAHQHGMDKRIQGVKREVTINIQTPIPVTFIETAPKAKIPAGPPPVPMKGSKSLLQKAGIVEAR